MRDGTPTSKRPGLTEAQMAQLRALDGSPDTTDIPSAPPESWADARRFFKPKKEAISIRLDADVLAWLRGLGDRYQSEINRILRERMEVERRG